VDKLVFFHKLKGLRRPEAVAQTLFLDGIETGQKIGWRAARRFRTFNPVDIQQIVHKAVGIERFLSRRRGFCWPWQPAWPTSCGCRIANASEVGKFFFDRTAAFGAGTQVYNQKLVYRIMVVVNGATLLWISRIFSTTSNVYGSHKPVGWSCMCLVAKLDKKRGCAKSLASSHFIPVDIHTLIHSPGSSC
jgi:hypothetical protein